ncbi:MAG TPA: F0F1 ATP synthase subunit B [Myxococcaceae bacterium]|nr:F0F1 ATP synthase subunit B [Myxococcaceae bacterium]
MPIVLATSSLVDVRPGLIFWTLVTFLLVALLLRRVAWGPILKVVDEREKAIAGSIESAKRERAEAERLLAEQKDAIQKARAEAADMMRRNAEDVEKLRVELVAKARAEAEAHKTDALREIENERVRAVNDVKKTAADLAIQITEKLLGKQLDDKTQKDLANQYLAEVSRTAGPPGRPGPKV